MSDKRSIGREELRLLLDAVDKKKPDPKAVAELHGHLDAMPDPCMALGSCATSGDYPRLAGVEAGPTLHLTKHPLPHILMIAFVAFVSVVVRSFSRRLPCKPVS